MEEQVPLAIVTVPMDSDRFARVEAAATKKFNEPFTGTSGDVSEHGGEITWTYVNGVLTFNIMKEFHFGFLHYSATKIQGDLLEWLSTVL